MLHGRKLKSMPLRETFIIGAAIKGVMDPVVGIIYIIIGIMRYGTVIYLSLISSYDCISFNEFILRVAITS